MCLCVFLESQNLGSFGKNAVFLAAALAANSSILHKADGGFDDGFRVGTKGWPEIILPFTSLDCLDDPLLGITAAVDIE